MAAEHESPTPGEQVARLYEQAETQAAKASEQLVGSRGFAAILGQFAENTAAMTKLGSDAMDLVLRNMRLAGRRDVVRLARQLARTEDKLERVLQEVEALRDQLEQQGAENRSPRRAGRSGGSGSSARSANGSRQRERKTT